MNIGKAAFPVMLGIGLSACGGGTGANLNTASAPVATGYSSISTSSNTTSSSGSTSTGSSITSNLSAEGVWRGTTSTGRTVTSLIIENGEYWMLYSAAANSSVTAGVIMGGSASSDGVITAVGSRDFDFETGGLYFLTLNGNYTAQSNLQGTLTYSDAPGAIVTFNAGYDGNYNTTSSLATLAGAYRGSGKSINGADTTTTYNISSTGQITGSRPNGCTFTGLATPRPTGKAYTISLRFNNSTCLNSTITTGGYAYFNPSTRQLYSVTRNSSNNDAFVFIGNK